MKFFKRYKTFTQDRHAWQDIIAVKFVNTVHKIQSVFAAFMNRKLNQLSVQKQKLLFIIFFLITGGLSGYYVIKGIWSKEYVTNAVKIDNIRLPKYDTKRNNERIVLTKKDYQSIVSFKQYMDSLYVTEEGKHQYDSILQARPGLMDSVQMLEDLYQSQQKH